VVGWTPAEEGDGWTGLHWKTRQLCEFAGKRPFAWIDDEITSADQKWVAENHAGKALLHRVDARVGLTGEDFTTIGAWLDRSTTA
jgi:hypothetical protein